MIIEMEIAQSNNSVVAKRSGEVLMRYGLVLVLAWIGAMKFTSYEALHFEQYCDQD